jgi:hypothetical protein
MVPGPWLDAKWVTMMMALFLVCQERNNFWAKRVTKKERNGKGRGRAGKGREGRYYSNSVCWNGGTRAIQCAGMDFYRKALRGGWVGY